jgi:type IV secretory pathway ATPase VirB11/archaellum biosynthesis ATPase
MCPGRDGSSSGTWWKSIRKLSSRDERSKPSFSGSWVLETDRRDPNDRRENRFLRTEIFGGNDPNGPLYRITPVEYSMSDDEVRTVMSIMDTLKMEPPPQNIIDDENAMRKFLERTSSARAQELSGSRDPDGHTLIGRITAQYTGGYGVLEHLLRDERVQDIYIDSPPSSKPVYVALGGGLPRDLEGTYATNILLTASELERIVSILRYHSGLPFSEASPVLECDLELYNARVTAVRPPMSPQGISIAIRKHSHDPWTLLRLVDAGAITAEGAAFLSLCIEGRSTMMIAGPRGAGKTSLLGALLFQVARSQRMIVIEDTPELPLGPLNRTGYKVLGLTIGSEGVSTSEMALRTALRLGESVLVLGEVRGPETRTLYEAMSAGTAGSAVLGTFHADSAKAVYKRTVEDLGVSAASFSATDLVVVSGLVQPKGKRTRLRRVVQISEVIKDGTPGSFRDLFLYDTSRNRLVRTSELGSSSILKRIAKLWGIPVLDITNEMALRTKVLEKALADLERKDIMDPATVPRMWENYHDIRDRALEGNWLSDHPRFISEWTWTLGGA